MFRTTPDPFFHLNFEQKFHNKSLLTLKKDAQGRVSFFFLIITTLTNCSACCSVFVIPAPFFFLALKHYFSSILSCFYPHVSFGARSPRGTSSPHELGETLFISSWLESTGKDEEEDFLRWGVWWLQTPPVSAVFSLVQINHPPTHVCKIRVAGVGREEEGELYNKRKKKRDVSQGSCETGLWVMMENREGLCWSVWSKVIPPLERRGRRRGEEEEVEREW